MAIHNHNHLCRDCGPEQLARNHYFTGKLLVERDFTDEQRYFLDKHERHNRYLHGWGVVCGLTVTPHPQPACRDRFVMLQPGLAIDGCGREIVVTDETCIPIAELIEEQWRKEHPDEELEARDVQLCIRHRECPAEEIPALLDGCATGDGCAPNRILESFEVDVLLEPRDQAMSAGAAYQMVGSAEIAIPGAARIAFARESAGLYVMAMSEPRKVSYVGESRTVEHEVDIPDAVDLAIADDNSHLFVLAPNTLHVLQGETLTSVREIALTDVINPIEVAARAGKVFVLDGGTSSRPARVLFFPAQVTDPAWSGTPDVAELAGEAVAMAPSDDGALVFVVSGGANPAVEAADSTNMVVPIGLSSVPLAVAASGDSGDYRVVIAEPDGIRILSLHGPRAGWPPNADSARHLPMDGTPVNVTVRDRWAFVTLTGTGGDRVQIVDLEADDETALGDSFPLPGTPQAIDLTNDSSYVLVAFDAPADGDVEDGVFGVELERANCDWEEHSLECPCDGDDCVVLATVRFEPEARIDEEEIDNRGGRRILPSVQALAEAMRCLDGGGTGREGRPGRDGAPGERGEPGEGIREDLVHICAATWQHGNYLMDLGSFPGLLLRFDGQVLVEDLMQWDAISLQQLVELTFGKPEMFGWHWVDVLRDVKAYQLEGEGCELPENADALPSPVDSGVSGATANAILIESPALTNAIGSPSVEFRLRIRGDFIRSVDGECVDLDNLITGLKDGGHTGNGLPGGVFESYFWLGMPQLVERTS